MNWMDEVRQEIEERWEDVTGVLAALAAIAVVAGVVLLYFPPGR